jgi:hypothetical protein
MTRYLDTVPQPWTRADIETAIFRSFTDAKKSIEEVPGARLWQALEDLDDTVWIFQASTTDLLDEICIFGDRSKNSTFWHKTNNREAEQHTLAVKRKLFYCTSSLMALVEHARNFERTRPTNGYTERLRQVFSTPGLHDFLQDLRNYNTHWRIAQANWTITHNFKPHTREARFTVTKAELLAWNGWKSKAAAYINQAADAIDIYELFSQYRRHVQAFYAWHRGAVIDQHADILQPYFEYKRLYEGLMNKYNWNLLISHVPKTLNPFQYLGQYLPKHQVERLLAHEHRSEVQVDALIKMLDMEEFCDEALREKVRALFLPSK